VEGGEGGKGSSSYTRANKGLGPGNFLSALVTFEVLTSMLSS